MVIFSDVDGVLRTERENIDEWNLLSVITLKYILTELKAKLVISSDWRLTSPELLKEKLKEYRLTDFLHEDWQTPHLVYKMSEYTGHRGREIEDWLDRNKVNDFIIIDDVFDFYEDQKDKVYLVDSQQGLRPRDGVLIIEKLK